MLLHRRSLKSIQGCTVDRAVQYDGWQRFGIIFTDGSFMVLATEEVEIVIAQKVDHNDLWALELITEEQYSDLFQKARQRTAAAERERRRKVYERLRKEFEDA